MYHDDHSPPHFHLSTPSIERKWRLKLWKSKKATCPAVRGQWFWSGLRSIGPSLLLIGSERETGYR